MPADQVLQWLCRKKHSGIAFFCQPFFDFHHKMPPFKKVDKKAKDL